MGFPGGSVAKNPPANAGDTRDVGLLPGLGRSPGGGHGDPLHAMDMKNPVDGGTWWAIVYGVAESDMTKAHRAGPRICLV